ncbi:hypothetical protein Hanom_Chr12g01079511 [Helianthus anomalus]
MEIGWNIVSKRIECIAYIVTYSKKVDKKMHLRVRGYNVGIGKKKDSKFMLVKAIVFTTRRFKKEKTYLKNPNLYQRFKKKPEQNKEYRIRLSTSVILAKGLLNGGLPFRGHDESEASLYRGHFIEFLKLFAQINEEIAKYILSNAPKNCQMTAPSIQKRHL